MRPSEDEVPLDVLLANVPDEVMKSFTSEQRAALWNAAKPISWRHYPINIRLSFSFFGRRHFITIVGGNERRSPERIHREQSRHPIRTAGNLLFMLGVGGTFYLFAVLGIFLFSNLIEF
ncbi:hypothetical protein [Magnetospirillum molischianum]|uniref:Uncharacterized protein n=1 Tax=Magnetospirillum molischianum DSM 120 TaxID=1150626 RepID=H8FTE0_MAGML|nr:hypothetical protein [Magnetospirillum molischianum]CCG41628.1 conserved hypothetical protein [Magnetospirillum molischianum DSM 120]